MEPPNSARSVSPFRSRVVIGVVALAAFSAAAAFSWGVFTRGVVPQTRGLTREIDRIRLTGPPQSIAVGQGAVWIHAGLDTESTLWRIDEHTGEVVMVPGAEGASWAAVSERFVWAVCEEEEPKCHGSWLYKLDPTSGRRLGRFRLPGYPSGIATGLGSVWVPTRAGLVRVDADQTSEMRILPGSYVDVGTAGGFVWATVRDRRRNSGLYQIDPKTGRVLRRIFGDPCNLEASGNAVWIATCRSRAPLQKRQESLTKVDATNGEVLFHIPVPSSGDMEVTGQALWMASWTAGDRPQIRVDAFDLANGDPIGMALSVRPGHERFIGPGQGGPVGPSLAADDHALWLSEFYAGEVIRVLVPAERRTAARTVSFSSTVPATRSTAPPRPSPTQVSLSENACRGSVEEDRTFHGI